MKLEERVFAYNTTFPKYPKLFVDKGWLIGSWCFGNNYRGSGYHGAYPPSYMKRIMSMFQDIKNNRILQLFSGSLNITSPGIRLDINPKMNPDVVGDAQNLGNIFAPNSFDLILADCPYSLKDATIYGYPMINRKKVISECFKILTKGGILVWMDLFLPMYRKIEFKRLGEIQLVRSTNHRFRGSVFFERA
jgi:hypothetical protein